MEKLPNHGLLVIIRHTESEWNLLGIWTGQTDVNITEKGAREARKIGELVKGIKFDGVYVSEQKRTHQTLEGVIEGSGHDPVDYYIRSALNERDYGDLTGKNKWEIREEIGEESFKGIRRGWDYPVPGGETLKDVYERVVPFFEKEVMPRLQSGENILLVAHGNTLRALFKYLEDLDEESVSETEMPFGAVVLYHFGEGGVHTHKEIRQADIVPPNA